MKKYLFVFLGLFLGFQTVFAEEDDPGKEILLERLVNSGNDTNRLNVLVELVGFVYQNPQEQLVYIEQLLEEAKKQKQDYYKCRAYLFYMFQAYNRYDGEEVNKWMKLLEPLAREKKFYDILFRGKQCVIDMLLLKEQYELEEKEANLMLKEAIELKNIIGQIGAYQSLAHVYMRTYRQDKAFDVLEKAVSLGPQCSNQYLCIETLRVMMINCEQREDLPNWFKYVKKQDSLITALEKKNPLESFAGNRLLNNLSYLRYYMKSDNREEAAECMKRMEDNYSGQYEIAYKYHYRESRSIYYMWLEEWDKGLAELDILLDLLKSISQVSYANRLVSKAKLLSNLDRCQEALVIYKQAKSLKDSLNVSTISKQAEQLKDSYKADLQILSAVKQQQRIQQLFLILAVIIILVLLMSIVHANRIKRKLTKAEQEMRNMMDETEQANKVKERFLANINMTIQPPLEIIVKNSSLLSSEEEIGTTDKERLSGLITATSERLMELINEILVLSKLEARMMKFNMKDVEMVSFVKSVVQVVNQKDPGRVLADIPDGYEFTMNGDENYLKQVISDLCQQPLDNNKNIYLKIEKTDEKELRIICRNTFLATQEPLQETVIRNEINRMLIESFGGKYHKGMQEDDPCIILTFNI